MKSIAVIPTISTGAYSTGDQLGDLQELSNAYLQEASAISLLSLAVVDQAGQNAPIDFLFFNETPTVASSDNAAADVSDAEMEAKCIGITRILAADYAALASNSIGSVADVNLILENADLRGRNLSLFVLAVVRSTPTYAATDDLKFIFSFDRGKR